MRLVDTTPPEVKAARQKLKDDQFYELGQAHALLCKAAGVPVRTHALVGTLVLSGSGWLLLTVPNRLVRGTFDALDEHGLELPLNSEGRLNAHITVMDPDEVAKCGGESKISERGHQFSYTLGPIKEVEPDRWSEMARIWYICVDSPDLRALRKSYGLEPLRKNYDMHVTVAVRRKHVLRDNAVSKSPSDAEKDASLRASAERLADLLGVS